MKIKGWLLSIYKVTVVASMILSSAVIVMISPVSYAADANKLLSTPEEWRAMFDKDLLSPDFKKDNPETQRVKILVLLALTLCQGVEHLAAMTLERDSTLARERYVGSLNCATEATAALKKQLPKAREELIKRPRAVDKLNAFAAAFLSTMSAIPRVPQSARALEVLQQQDKRKIQDREAELDVELL